MVNPRDFAMHMIRNNPSITNNPIAQNYINVLQSGDAQKGQQIAQNILNCSGLPRERALQQVGLRFHIRLMGQILIGN